jgi:hypothetical protein
VLGGKPVDALNFIEYKYAGNLSVPRAAFFHFSLEPTSSAIRSSDLCFLKIQVFKNGTNNLSILVPVNTTIYYFIFLTC